MLYTYNYPHFALTVDAVIIYKSDVGLDVLLIRRAHEPFKDCWAFPGGYVNIDELIDNAVYRELEEETNISNVPIKAGDDAKDVQWFPVNKLPELAFDHSEILKKILEVVQK